MRRREALTPDLTPLIDVVFLILIFFLVSSVFKKEELALLLNLPKSDQVEVQMPKENIDIELTLDEIAFAGKKVSFSALDTLLAQIEDKERAVVLRIDAKVEYARIVKLFDSLKKHELNNIALLNEKVK